MIDRKGIISKKYSINKKINTHIRKIQYSLVGLMMVYEKNKASTKAAIGMLSEGVKIKFIDM
ncbi:MULTISPECIES: hypothetical protein [unclassified Flavobacterium]|uniref:hypothetical protein n=1 Tax=unclassified Flavobacterium TaxID=196869 RepID=UPI001F1CDCB2|nr:MULTISPECIES: hypothetical protein [unclassified Flavobacterium]